MDKYEYNLKLDQIKSLCAEENYAAAAEICDTMNWNRIRNVNALVKAGEVYEKVGRYDESHSILLMAYDRSPIGRMIIYRLAELAVKMSDFTAAEEYYEEFVEIAPHDNLKYVLRYHIKKAQGNPVKELIPILEELKEQEYSEEWAYELAYLYHQAGMSEKCIDACDELILWFGDGPYVERALELKMLYHPLSKAQEEKYRLFRQAKDGFTHITEEEMQSAGEYSHAPVAIPPVSVNVAEKFNTVNLQEEIAKGMQQIMEATKKDMVEDTMDNIKKIVEEIPYLQLPKETEEETEHIETDEEIDGSLKINFQEMLGEESDGQISLLTDDQAIVEHQITGQMTISDILEEWEKTKRAAEAALQEAEQRKLESAKARALQEAGDIMDRLNDVIPKLDAGIKPIELLEEEYLAENAEPIEKATELFENVNSMLDEEIERISNEMDMVEITADEFPEEEVVVEEAPVEEAPVEEAPIEEAPVEEAPEEEVPVEEVPVEDTPVEDTPVEEAPVTENTVVFPRITIPEITIPEPIVTPIVPVPVPEPVVPVPEVLPEIAPVELAATQKIELPAQELGKTRKMPTRKELGLAKGRTGKLPEIVLPEDLGVSEEVEEKKLLTLSDEQKAIFSYFMPIKGMESQICEALTGIATRLNNNAPASSGNIIIQGGQGCGKTVLATSFIKVVQQETGKLKGKVGKIDAVALNSKDPQQLLQKVAGGCLIIEQAGELTRESAIKLSFLMENDTTGLLVILEGTAKGIKKALALDEGFAQKFSEQIEVPIFNNDELVSFARAYSNELGYEIEEMAILALYNRISNIQRLDQATTLTEVKEIVDEAIEREAHGGLKKAISILTAKRYTDDDKIVLTEKDFE